MNMPLSTGIVISTTTHYSTLELDGVNEGTII